MYETFRKLLDTKGIKAADFSRATGISEATISTWKKRGVIGNKHMKVVADFFGVPIDYLMTGETDARYYENSDTAAIAQEIFDNHELRVLFDAARDADPEDLKTTYNMLMALKRKEQGDA